MVGTLLLGIAKEQINALLLCIVGVVILVTNKPIGEGCRQWQIMMFQRDYGILSFRVPVIIIGALFMLTGLSFLFFQQIIEGAAEPQNNDLMLKYQCCICKQIVARGSSARVASASVL